MSDTGGNPTRRSLLTGAGAAIAGGVALAAAPGASAQTDPREVATARDGATAVEFRSRISQSGSTGESFTSLGFLTKVHGLRTADLFAGSTTTVGTALFTAVASGDLTARVLDQMVHALDIHGEMSVYQRSAPGADFTDPSSFTSGKLVARYSLVLQDVLAVIDTAKGVPTLTGDMVQSRAAVLRNDGRRFGHDGERLRFFATGLGHLVDPVTLNAELEIAGNWSAV